MREGIRPEDAMKVKNENLMMFKMVWLWLYAEAAQEESETLGHKVGFCMEFPEDPRAYLPEGAQSDACVSVWRTGFMKELLDVTEMSLVQFEQGALGHALRRPTCCLTNLGLGIHGMKDSRCWTSKDDGSDDQTVWPHGFRITVADAIHEWNRNAGQVALKKAMTRSEMTEWKAHVERGHWPYRRDCFRMSCRFRYWTSC